MSDISLYDASISVYITGTTTLVNLLQKAAQSPEGKATAPQAADLPLATLVSDMKPLSFHVQSVCNTVRISLKKLAQDSFEAGDDDETTMGQLVARAQETLTFLQGISPTTFEGREDLIVTLPSGQMSAKQFIFRFSIPSFFFHLQTVYSILRKEGVPLGKDDWMGPWSQGAW